MDEGLKHIWIQEHIDRLRSINDDLLFTHNERQKEHQEAIRALEEAVQQTHRATLDFLQSL